MLNTEDPTLTEVYFYRLRLLLEQPYPSSPCPPGDSVLKWSFDTVEREGSLSDDDLQTIGSSPPVLPYVNPPLSCRSKRSREGSFGNDAGNVYDPLKRVRRYRSSIGGSESGTVLDHILTHSASSSQVSSENTNSRPLSQPGTPAHHRRESAHTVDTTNTEFYRFLMAAQNTSSTASTRSEASQG